MGEAVAGRGRGQGRGGGVALGCVRRRLGGEESSLGLELDFLEPFALCVVACDEWRERRRRESGGWPMGEEGPRGRPAIAATLLSFDIFRRLPSVAFLFLFLFFYSFFFFQRCLVKC